MVVPGKLRAYFLEMTFLIYFDVILLFLISLPNPYFGAVIHLKMSETCSMNEYYTFEKKQNLEIYF